jgi:hypothetical protein
MTRPLRDVRDRNDRRLVKEEKMTRFFAVAALTAATILGATFAMGVYAQAAEAPAVTIDAAL